jgi:ribosome-binding protein aMBF1 (putative translation factor)
MKHKCIICGNEIKDWCRVLIGGITQDVCSECALRAIRESDVTTSHPPPPAQPVPMVPDKPGCRHKATVTYRNELTMRTITRCEECDQILSSYNDGNIEAIKSLAAPVQGFTGIVKCPKCSKRHQVGGPCTGQPAPVPTKENAK